MTAVCRHPRSRRTSATVGYTGCVAPYDCEPRCHVAVVHIERCECGKVKRTASNGRYSETSGWARS
jgi:hypothetical protein